MRSSRPSRRSPCRKASRRRACIGPSRASFQGLREDKSAEEVLYDPAKLGKAPDPQPGRGAPKPRASEAPRSKATKAPAVSRSETKPSAVSARDGSVEFAGVRLTHPE